MCSWRPQKVSLCDSPSVTANAIYSAGYQPEQHNWKPNPNGFGNQLMSLGLL